jgi:hypothetical protein
MEEEAAGGLKKKGREEEAEGALENRDDAAEYTWGTFWVSVFLCSVPILIPVSFLLADGGLIIQLGTHCTPASGLFSLPPFCICTSMFFR